MPLSLERERAPPSSTSISDPSAPPYPSLAVLSLLEPAPSLRDIGRGEEADDDVVGVSEVVAVASGRAGPVGNFCALATAAWMASDFATVSVAADNTSIFVVVAVVVLVTVVMTLVVLALA